MAGKKFSAATRPPGDYFCKVTVNPFAIAGERVSRVA